MKKSLLLSMAVGALGLAVAAPAQAQNLRGEIKIDGSSTVFPITEAVAEEFQDKYPNVRVTVGVSGTGGGFKRFVKGETDISNASRPIKSKEDKATQDAGIEYIEIPVAYDGLTIVVNKRNYWVDNLTVDELKSIFLEDSAKSTWSEVRDGWPDIPIRIYSPGTDSGTFDYFKEVIAGKTGTIRGDMSVSEDDNVLVRGVSGEEGAIGFFGCAYYFENADKLKGVPIDGGNGPVSPKAETIADGSYAPFSRPLFVYVNSRSAKKREIREFVNFYLDNAAELSAEVGYVGLPESVYERAARNFKRLKTGTFFLDDKGEKVHGPLEEVFK